MLPVLLSAALFASSPSGPPVSWSFSSESLADGTVQVVLTATMEEGWHIYATVLENELGPLPTAVRFNPSETYEMQGGLLEPTPIQVFDPNFEMQVQYHSGTVRFVQQMKPKFDGQVEVSGEVEYMVCNDRTCLPPKLVTFSLDLPKL